MYSLYTQYFTLGADPKAALGLLQAILTAKPTPVPAGSFLNTGMTYPDSPGRALRGSREKLCPLFVLAWPRGASRQELGEGPRGARVLMKAALLCPCLARLQKGQVLPAVSLGWKKEGGCVGQGLLHPRTPGSRRVVAHSPGAGHLLPLGLSDDISDVRQNVGWARFPQASFWL